MNDLITTDETTLYVREVAAMLRVSPMVIHRLIAAGELSAIRVGKSIRIPRTELERFLADNVVVAA